MVSILFVCTANQIRSPFAMATFQQKLDGYKLSEKGWITESAGTWAETGFPATEKVQAEARRLNIPGLEKHQSRPITEQLIQQAALVIVMERNQKEALATEFSSYKNKIRMLTEFIPGPQYDIPDPGLGQARTEEITTEIHAIIEKGFQKICETAWENAQKP